jgi:hypothetical protein
MYSVHIIDVLYRIGELGAVGGYLAAWPLVSNSKLAILLRITAYASHLRCCRLAGRIDTRGVSGRGPERRNPAGHEYRVA